MSSSSQMLAMPNCNICGPLLQTMTGTCLTSLTKYHTRHSTRGQSSRKATSEAHIGRLRFQLQAKRLLGIPSSASRSVGYCVIADFLSELAYRGSERVWCHSQAFQTHSFSAPALTLQTLQSTALHSALALRGCLRCAVATGHGSRKGAA